MLCPWITAQPTSQSDHYQTILCRTLDSFVTNQYKSSGAVRFCITPIGVGPVFIRYRLAGDNWECFGLTYRFHRLSTSIRTRPIRAMACLPSS